MARGDGKATRGKTKGKMLGAKRMATGGFASSSREGGFAGAGTGRLESPGQRSSVSPGGGNISAGNTPGGGGQGGSQRPSGASPAGQMARLGSMPASSMTQAGIPSSRAQMLAGLMNDLATPKYLRGTDINTLTPGGKIADRIEPTEGYIPEPKLFSTPKAPQAPTGRVPGYIDQQSIVPGSVSFTQASKFTPFAQTPTGQELLAMSKKPMTAEQAEALKDKFPPGSAFYAQPGKGFLDLKQSAAAQMYPAPKNLSGLDTYPATIGGYKFNVGVPKNAGVNDPYGPKIGQYNPGPVKPITDRVAAQSNVVSETRPKQFTDRIPQAGGAAPAGVVAGPRTTNLTSSDRPFGGRDGRDRDDRPIRKKKKPIIEEGTTAAKSGGLISRGDGKASRGKTKGRYI
jgi:hypothetical protein